MIYSRLFGDPAFVPPPLSQPGLWMSAKAHPSVATVRQDRVSASSSLNVCFQLFHFVFSMRNLLKLRRTRSSESHRWGWQLPGEDFQRIA